MLNRKEIAGVLVIRTPLTVRYKEVVGVPQLYSEGITMHSVVKLLLGEGERVVGDGARVELTREHEVALRCVRVRVRRAAVRAHQHVAAQRQPPHAHRPAAAVHHVQTCITVHIF